MKLFKAMTLATAVASSVNVAAKDDLKRHSVGVQATVGNAQFYCCF